MNPDDARCAWLTTLRPDGSPHTTPIWFVLLGDTFWIASSTVNRKVRNLLADPRVSLALDGTSSRPWVAEGLAAVGNLDDHPDVVRRLAEKYAGWDPADEAQDGPRVLVEVPVARWLMREDAPD